MHDNEAAYFNLFFAGRMVIVGFGVVLGLGIFLWARSLFGATVALATLLLYCTCPIVLGHASLATLDVGVTMFVLGGFLALVQLAQTKSWRWAATSGLLFGLAMTAKFNALFFLPLIPLLLAMEWLPQGRRALLPWMGSLAILGLFIVVGINAGYLFSDLPLPKSFIDGLTLRIKYGQQGEFPSFLWGSWAEKGWRSYYLVAMFYKMPIPFLLLLAIGLVGLLRGLLSWKRAAWIGVPPALLIYVMSFHYHVNYGVRWLLPAMPFLFMIAGFGVQRLLRGGRLKVGLLWVLLIWQVAACCFSAPHHLAYFNELAGGPARARRILLDSNLDWGQDLGRLKDYMDERGIREIRLGYFGHVDPSLYGIKYSFPLPRPEPGVYAISANYLGGYPYAITYFEPQILAVPAGAWSWLDEYTPTHLVGRSIYVFEIPKVKEPPNAPAD
jgi:4-amino-4-deoxy-L-arabinose transferase-like glycosyltransferase